MRVQSLIKVIIRVRGKILLVTCHLSQACCAARRLTTKDAPRMLQSLLRSKIRVQV